MSGPRILRALRRALPAVLVVLALLATLPPARADGDIRIVRDRFGVPHIYGATAEDVSFGAGYALAQDRLWQMHVFRLVAKGHLSDLLGPLVVDIDRDIRFFTYTAAERAAKFDNYPGKEKQNLVAFAEGVNAWIEQVRTDPTKLPFEFVEFAVPEIPDWTVDDSLALSDVLILSFGAGGGNELEHAALLKSLIAQHGQTKAMQMFDDLVVTEDPDGPITIPADFDYENQTTAARVAEAESRRALTPDARLGMTPAYAAASATAGLTLAPKPLRSRPTAKGTLAQLRLIPDIDKALEGFRPLQQAQEALRRMFHFGSNAQIVGPAHTESGNAAQTAGPQVDYLLPQWLSDFGLHSADGTLNATGMTFAGAGPAVLIGRGNGFAWTTTTGSSDLQDTYVEKLNPANPREYLYNGVYEPMQCRTEEYALRGLVPFETQEICRTRHGPVVAFDEANGVAYSVRYSWFNREAQTVEGFFAYNRVKNMEDFATFANYLGSNHNMFYVDDKGHYGYWTPGNHPVRPEGVDIRLPQDGTGGSEWEGLVPVQEIPHAVDFPRGWLSNWNNQPALGWKRERGWTAIDNSADLARTLNPALPAVNDPRDGVPINVDRKVDFEDLSGNLRYAAFKDHRDSYFRPYLPADAALGSNVSKAAAQLVRDWDGFLTDRDDDGMYDSSGSTIVREWAGQMRSQAFGDDLGGLSGWANESLLWHLLNPNDTLTQGFGWLGATTTAQLAAKGFNDAVAALQARFESDDPATWTEKAAKEHYQRLNADLFTDTALTTLRDRANGNGLAQLGDLLDDLVHADLGWPGDVVDQIQMDRGTYNHVVTYLDPPHAEGEIGASRVHAGSVIPPGQSGFINILGQEAPHYEDQAILYLEWRYKPMPMTLAEALALAESEETISR